MTDPIAPIAGSVEATDINLRSVLRHMLARRGGRFHGPNVEHLSIPEAAFWSFMDDALRMSAQMMRERCARVADAPLAHRVGTPGLWRQRRTQIAAEIRALSTEADDA